MATALLSGFSYLFSGVRVQMLGSLSCREVHPSSPVLLTRNGPLGRRISPCSQRNTPLRIQSLRMRYRCSSDTRLVILFTAQNCRRPAVLRDISEGTSYQTVRLVFRPYTQVPRSI